MRSETAKKMLEVLETEMSTTPAQVEEADAVVKGLMENLLRGWGLHQFAIGDAQVGLLICLMYARASMQQDCSINEAFIKVKEEVRSFCESYWGLHTGTIDE